MQDLQYQLSTRISDRKSADKYHEKLGLTSEPTYSLNDERALVMNYNSSEESVTALELKAISKRVTDIENEIAERGKIKKC